MKLLNPSFYIGEQNDISIIQKERSRKNSKTALNNKEIENIKNEAKILSCIDNENIVKYYDSFIDNDCFNIVMEFCEGLDFRNFINYMKQTGEYINESIIYFFIKRICLGLKEIHKKNLIHRDLKAENIFLTVDIKVKIGDFGISKPLKN